MTCESFNSSDQSGSEESTSESYQVVDSIIFIIYEGTPCKQLFNFLARSVGIREKVMKIFAGLVQEPTEFYCYETMSSEVDMKKSTLRGEGAGKRLVWLESDEDYSLISKKKSR